MNNALLIATSWLAVTLHLVVAVLVLRRMSELPLVPLMNLAVAGCVLLYWMRQWYGYLFRGITWYVADQWLPLCALCVCVLCVFTLAGKYRGALPHAIIFGIDTAVLLAAAIFFTVFRMDRMI